MKKLRKILLVLLVLVVVGIGLLNLPGNIEGRWRNIAYVSCLCDSYNFWEFADGKVTHYASNHPSGQCGKYERIEGGKYRVSWGDGGSGKNWIVRPSLFRLHIIENDSPYKARLQFVAEFTWRILFRARSDDVKAIDWEERKAKLKDRKQDQPPATAPEPKSE